MHVPRSEYDCSSLQLPLCALSQHKDVSGAIDSRHSLHSPLQVMLLCLLLAEVMSKYAYSCKE